MISTRLKFRESSKMKWRSFSEFLKALKPKFFERYLLPDPFLLETLMSP